nr:hypothetical protein [Tanacetum cinerariifolium]GEY46631.1 hypothetical protein [Tanacetum cinerariifolium]
MAIEGGQGCRNNGNRACRKAFKMGAEEARQDLNIVTEINKVIRGCKLVIEGHTFDIDLIPFGHRSFDVIVGMDWLSRHKAKIVFYEKVVRIPQPYNDILRVLGEKPEEKVRCLMSAKTEEQRLKDIIVVRSFPEEQEEAFQILKDKLYNAPVLALPDKPEDFIVYCDASGLGLELFGNYDCEIRYHPGKANVVADALSRKERINPKRVRTINMTIQSSIKDRILAAQNEASEVVDAPSKMLRGLDKQMECRRVDKMYYDLRDRYWWPEMKKDIALYRIAMNFVMELPRTSSRHDAIWVIVDRLTKSAHFPPMRKDYKMDRLARLYLNEFIAKHGVPISIISDHDSCFTSRFWQSMQKELGTRKKGKLTPRFVGPFEITERIDPVAYRLRLPQELNNVHDTFHVSNLKKCLVDQTKHVTLEEIQVDAKLNFLEEPVEILE